MAASLQELANAIGNKTQPTQPQEQPAVQTSTETTTPIAEPSATKVTETTQVTNEAPTETKVSQISEPAKSFFEIPENYRDKVKSWNDVETLISSRVEEEKSKVEPRYKHDVIKMLDELVSEGIEPTPELFYEATLNYDSYDADNIVQAKELLFKQMKFENPNLSDDKIRRLINSEYKGLVDGDESDEDFQEAQLRLSVAAEKAKVALKQRQQKLKFPERKNAEILRQQEEDKARQQRELLSRTFDSVTADYKGYGYKVGDEQHSVEFTPEQMAPVKNLFVDPSNLIKSFVTSEGFDHGAYMRFLVRGMYADQLVSAAVKQAQEATKLTAFTDRENAELKTPPSSKSDTVTPQSEFTRQLNTKYSGGSGYNIPIV